MRNIRRVTAALLVVAAALAAALPVWAHAELVSTVPAAGATVPAGLWELKLMFTEPIGRGSEVVVYAEQFQSVAGVTNEVNGTELRARFTTALGEGVYTVQWTAIGADGHPMEGSYQFALSRAAGTGQGPLIIFITSLVGGILALGAVVLLARRSRR